MSEKYIRVSELGVGPCNPAVFTDPERAYGWNELLKIIQSVPTYTPADILSGMWVPVTERLPEAFRTVALCVVPFGCETYPEIRRTGFIDDEGEWFLHDKTLGNYSVTHWMEPPAAPTENEN